MDLSEVKNLVTAQGTAWEEFKKTNDERLAKLAKGESVADIEAKLAKMETALTDAGKELKEIALKAQRPVLSGEKQEQNEKELKTFNATAQAAAIEAGKSFAPLSAEGYASFKEALGI